MVFAEVNGETVAFSRVWWRDEDGALCESDSPLPHSVRLYISLGFIHPAERMVDLLQLLSRPIRSRCGRRGSELWRQRVGQVVHSP